MCGEWWQLMILDVYRKQELEREQSSCSIREQSVQGSFSEHPGHAPMLLREHEDPNMSIVQHRAA